jgi:hypothetical protein
MGRGFHGEKRHVVDTAVCTLVELSKKETVHLTMSTVSSRKKALQCTHGQQIGFDGLEQPVGHEHHHIASIQCETLFRIRGISIDTQRYTGSATGDENVAAARPSNDRRYMRSVGHREDSGSYVELERGSRHEAVDRKFKSGSLIELGE